MQEGIFAGGGWPIEDLLFEIRQIDKFYDKFKYIYIYKMCIYAGVILETEGSIQLIFKLENKKEFHV